MTFETLWGVAYYAEDGSFVLAETTTAPDYMSACDKALEAMPVGADDFHLIDDKAVLASGCNAIRAAADTFLRQYCGRALEEGALAA